MGKSMELEVKILNVNEQEIIKKIEMLGGKLIAKYNQYLYTYDLPTIYGRYIDLLTQINDHESEIKYQTAISRFKLLFFEIDNLLNNEDMSKLKQITKHDNLTCILNEEDRDQILNKKELIEFISKFHNNNHKWIRVRKSNETTTITVKHVLKDDDSGIQQMQETEIKVSGLQEANLLLEALGYSYKSYQEKRRVSYKLEKHEIDIDTWPGIPTYFEVEGEDKEDLEKVINLLGYKWEDTVSCTADDIYRKLGKSMFEKRELKFED